MGKNIRIEDKKKIKKLLKQAVEKDKKSVFKRDKKTIFVFKKNAELLKSIINKYGWPFSDKNAFHNAWLIAQHADHDPYFQLQCFGLMLPEIRKDKEIMISSAFLIDRILIKCGKKQIFGTQFNGKLKKPNVFSPKQLELLRKKIGVESMQIYLNRMKKFSKIPRFGKGQKVF